jgi:hypothetical protein
MLAALAGQSHVSLEEALVRCADLVHWKIRREKATLQAERVDGVSNERAQPIDELIDTRPRGSRMKTETEHWHDEAGDLGEHILSLGQAREILTPR